MENLILISLVLGLFGFILIFPTLINLFRAKLIGLNLSFSDSWKLTRSKVVNRAFLKSILNYRQNDIPFEINDLISQRLAGGNLDNCLNGLIYAKENELDANFQMVSAIDLVGKNVVDSFTDSNKIYYIQIKGLVNAKISIEYRIEYKYQFPSVFIDKDEEKVKSKISNKIIKFLETWTGDNEIEAEQMIRNNILNSDYWENNLRIIAIRQDFTIRKK